MPEASTHTHKRETGTRDRDEDDRVIETDPRQKIQTKKKPTRDEESSGRQIDTEERDFDTKKQRNQAKTEGDTEQFVAGKQQNINTETDRDRREQTT